jgi:hypothetical protein
MLFTHKRYLANKQSEYIFGWYVQRRLLNEVLGHSLLGIHCTLVAGFNGINIPSATPFSLAHLISPSIPRLAIYFTIITMVWR